MMRTPANLLHRSWITLGTIRARLTIWYVILLGLTLVGFSAFLLVSLSHNLYSALDDSLRTDARQVVEDLDTRRGVARLGGDFPPGVLVSLYDGDGSQFLGSSSSNPLPDLPE